MLGRAEPGRLADTGRLVHLQRTVAGATYDQVNDAVQTVVGATATLEVSPSDSEALALARAAGELSLVLRSYADTAGPSGRVASAPRAQTAEARSVRIFRGGEPEVVSVP